MPDQPQPAVIPHLVVDDAAAAIDFYVKAFGAVEHGRVPGPDGRLVHASLAINGSSIMLMDDFPEASDGKSMTPTSLRGTPVTIHLQVTEDVDAKFQQALDAGATVIAPVEDQFWGDRYGVVRDPFGHHWSLGQQVREVSMEELRAAMGQGS
jgi:PhnB protein